MKGRRSVVIKSKSRLPVLRENLQETQGSNGRPFSPLASDNFLGIQGFSPRTLSGSQVKDVERLGGQSHAELKGLVRGNFVSLITDSEFTGAPSHFLNVGEKYTQYNKPEVPGVLGARDSSVGPGYLLPHGLTGDYNGDKTRADLRFADSAREVMVLSGGRGWPRKAGWL